MEELYWIGRIGALQEMAQMTALIGGLVCFGLGVFLLKESSEYNPDSEWSSDQRFAKVYKIVLKVLKVTSIVFLVSCVVLVFVPSKREMLVIYGGGKVLEFVENDSIAQQLPHDAVEALHKYLTEEE